MKRKKVMMMLAVVFSVVSVFSVGLKAEEVLYVPFEDCSLLPRTVVYVGLNLQPMVLQFRNGQQAVAGDVAKGASFNGTRYVEIPDKEPMLNVGIDDFAVTFLIKTTSTKRNNTVIDKRASSSAAGYHVTIYDGCPLLRMHDVQGTGYNYWGGPGSKKVNDGKWHHVAIYVDRSEANGGKIYVDGLCVHTFNPTRHMNKSLSTTSPLLIGKHTDLSNYHFEGSLDEVRLFRSVPNLQAVRR